MGEKTTRIDTARSNKNKKVSHLIAITVQQLHIRPTGYDYAPRYIAAEEKKEYNNSVLRINISMCMLDEIRAKRDEIYAIARAHKAEKLWVFGSCARKEETPILEER